MHNISTELKNILININEVNEMVIPAKQKP